MNKPKHPCAEPGCSQLTDMRVCSAHYQKRPSARKLGYSSKWDAYSKHFLRQHPFCCDPFARHRGQVVAANVTGHIHAHKGDFALLWDKANHYPLCTACNAFQCATEEGGFGRERSLVSSPA